MNQKSPTLPHPILNKFKREKNHREKQPPASPKQKRGPRNL